MVKGTKDYAFVGVNGGKSIGLLPFSVAFEFDFRRAGGNPYISPGWDYSFGLDTFMGKNSLSTEIGASYGVNYYWGDRK